MFTDKELDILEIEIFPVVIKFNDLQKVFENLNEDQVELFSKWCQSEDIDTSNMIIGTFGREENDVLYLRGNHIKGYKKYKGSYRHGSYFIKEVKTETRIILPEDCKNMFNGCDKLESIDVSNGDVSNVRDMDWMFTGCDKLEFLNVSNGDVSKVESMYNMFYKCESLEELDVSNGDVSNVEDMYGMFYGCESLKELKGILNGDLHYSLNTYKMFNGMPLLKDKDKILQKFGVK